MKAACEPAGITLCVCVQHIEIFALRAARFVCFDEFGLFVFCFLCPSFVPAGSSKNSTATRARAVGHYVTGAADTCDI